MKALRCLLRGHHLILLLLIPLFLLSACFNTPRASAAAPYTLTLVNQSQTPVYQFQYSHGGTSGGVANADGSPFKKGDSVDLDFTFPDGEVLVSARSAQDETLAARKIQLAFSENGQMILHLMETSAGLAFQTP